MQKYFLLMIGFAVWLTGRYPLLAAPPSTSYELLYQDNFQGAELNTNDWNYRLGKRGGMGMYESINQKQNVTVSNGLHIAVCQATNRGQVFNTGGGIISRHQFGYGYYETLSIPFMAGHGVHSSFWQAGGVVPNNNIFEIDGYEIDSKSRMASHNLYVHLSPKEYKETPWPMRANVPLTLAPDGSYLLGYEYTPDGVRFYEAGKLITTADWPQLTAQQVVQLTALNGVGKVDGQPGETVFNCFRFYAKDYPGVNLLPNGSFEYNLDKINPQQPVAWRLTGTNLEAVKVLAGSAPNGHYYLRLGLNDKPFSVTTSQKLEFIRKGNYELTAMVRSSGGLENAEVDVRDADGEQHQVTIPESAYWQMIRLAQVNVTTHQATIAISAQGLPGQWVEIDDVRFQKPPLKEQELVSTPPFLPVGEPIWRLARQDPIHFRGDGKFYFFDRNVGLGEAITVAFTMVPDRLAATIPIARMPATGPDGWAVLLTADGGIDFQIGSTQQHRDIVAAAHCQPGKVSRIACVFNRGTAQIFVDGKLLQTASGISLHTLDQSAPGRLGSVDNLYQAVGDVIMRTRDVPEAAAGKRPRFANFTGSLAGIQIYNRALDAREIIKIGASDDR